MRRASLVLCLLCLFCAGSCDEPGVPSLDLERMIVQDRYQSYEPCELFPDGRSMRTPPGDTVSHDSARFPAELITFAVNGVPVDRIPMPVTRQLLARGQDRYQIYCAACHGVAGDGQSWVARKMTLRKPPPLIGPRVRSFPPGRVYQIIQEGYGLMRSYAEDLDPEEQWAIVAYLRALDVASWVSLDALPPAARARAEEELR